MVLLFTFLALILLRFILLGLGAYLLVPPIRDCPACFRDTAPVRLPWLERLTRFEWRWCTHCGWKGLALRRRGATHG